MLDDILRKLKRKPTSKQLRATIFDILSTLKLFWIFYTCYFVALPLPKNANLLAQVSFQEKTHSNTESTTKPSGFGLCIYTQQQKQSVITNSVKSSGVTQREWEGPPVVPGRRPG